MVHDGLIDPAQGGTSRMCVVMEAGWAISGAAAVQGTLSAIALQFQSPEEVFQSFPIHPIHSPRLHGRITHRLAAGIGLALRAHGQALSPARMAVGSFFPPPRHGPKDCTPLTPRNGNSSKPVHLQQCGGHISDPRLQGFVRRKGIFQRQSLPFANHRIQPQSPHVGERRQGEDQFSQMIHVP